MRKIPYQPAGEFDLHFLQDHPSRGDFYEWLTWSVSGRWYTEQKMVFDEQDETLQFHLDQGMWADDLQSLLEHTFIYFEKIEDAIAFKLTWL